MGRSRTSPKPVRHLVIVLGDQLDREAAAFDGFDPDRDQVWMAEVAEESTHVWTHKARIALFLAAMRHFAAQLRKKNTTVHYRSLDDPDNQHSLARELSTWLEGRKVEKLILTRPGEYRVLKMLEGVASHHNVPLELRPDRHFLCSLEDFRQHAKDRKQLRMEFFYREMRRKNGVLMDGDEPEGGEWNFDSENRDAFGKSGPGKVPAPRRFRPDSTTRKVLDMVAERFADHPGELETFDWPVTRRRALSALKDFIRHRLADFGRYQDAMWTGEPFLYHSRLSAALNLKLLHPREVIEAAEAAYRAGEAPLEAVEGFIRQILGWREYVRGVYWLHMPGYLDRNTLKADLALPSFYWDGQTEMRCLRETIGQTLRHGYAHHIQRLMVTGLFALLYGTDPRKVHEWYLAVYVDAVEWVELPNTLGMSQYADDGVMGSKPYAATGKYIDRMSNYCGECPFQPGDRTGSKACPFTTLYWDFLLRHRSRLESNPRMKLQLRNVARLTAGQKRDIRERAADIRRHQGAIKP